MTYSLSGRLVLIGRLIVLAADQRGDLVPDTELRAADQLPGPADPAQEADDHQDRDRVHRAGVVRMGDNRQAFDQLEDEYDHQPDQEKRVPHDAPPHLAPAQNAHPDQRQQRGHDEREAGGGHGYRGRTDLVPGDQREQRHGQRVGERRQRRRRADAVDLRLGLPLGEPPAGHRDRYEQQPDQRARHAGGGDEEIMDVFWDHLAILPGAAGSAADGVEFGDRLGRQDQSGRRDVLAEVRDRRGAGDEDHRGRAPQQPGQRD